MIGPDIDGAQSKLPMQADFANRLLDDGPPSGVKPHRFVLELIALGNL